MIVRVRRDKQQLGLADRVQLEIRIYLVRTAYQREISVATCKNSRHSPVV